MKRGLELTALMQHIHHSRGIHVRQEGKVERMICRPELFREGHAYNLGRILWGHCDLQLLHQRIHTCPTEHVAIRSRRVPELIEANERLGLPPDPGFQVPKWV